MPKLVRAAVLTNYLEVTQYLGFNPRDVLAGVGLSKALLQAPEHRIPIDAAVRLLEDSAAASGCQNFGLSMAESRQLSDFGVVSLLLSHQRTLRDALQVVVHYRHLMNDSLAIFIEEAGKMVIIREEVVTDSPMPSRQATELAIGVMFRLCAALLGSHWHPYSVNFTHQPPDNLQLHRRLFGCTLEFGSEFNGIVCAGASLDMTNANADPAMARYAQSYLDSLQSHQGTSMLFEVRKAIYLLLPMGRATIEQVAQSQGMNVRTLQRRLKDDGCAFNDVINDVRRDLVLRYLDNPNYTLGRIADMLGYSMASSFTRWFISQFGMPPATWRVQKQGSAKAPTDAAPPKPY
ncbi:MULTISPECIES: AraC family transcriptional regulator [Pseudomonas]|jgi:AraC-like DNA-binding protein|uniref:AraC family transcriptional regulator n=1 Tax=Pseudomonas migulae TaxID=78543 RepID=A0ABY8N200_9PSED|nr:MULTISPECIES: AraC family transcriptional regulator [Pseudomonas]EJM78365.1 DNA-binding domain-containing protein, AraC-type [Pseudomonas sp. GM60]MBD9610517.1 AraC family transcriptional regulator [Pseudomonas sp. PDM02]MCP1517686.1 AraC-like DNA-binding protein [Pseudomonas migulae]UCP10358.1 AraC family transcriptional regulator [Pseudomonas sp. MM213]WGK92666.1 AraC family transcriptional regulator [Pseudomonas migulae]